MLISSDAVTVVFVPVVLVILHHPVFSLPTISNKLCKSRDILSSLDFVSWMLEMHSIVEYTVVMSTYDSVHLTKNRIGRTTANVSMNSSLPRFRICDVARAEIRF